MLDLKSNYKTQKTEIKKQAFHDSFWIRLIEKINRSFNLILVFLIIIFVGSLIFSSYWLYSQNIKPLQASIYNKENSRFDLERQLKTLQDEKLSIAELNISNMQIFQILPQRRELLGVFTQLESLAQQNNLIILDTKESSTSQKVGKDELELNVLELKYIFAPSELLNLQNFILDIKQNIKLINIAELEFMAEKEYGLTVEMYYFGEEIK